MSSNFNKRNCFYTAVKREDLDVAAPEEWGTRLWAQVLNVLSNVPLDPVPSANAINLWVKSFVETAKVTKKWGGSVNTARTSKNFNWVHKAVIRRRRESTKRHRAWYQ